jgi:predicted PurR-regulated permease PerM
MLNSDGAFARRVAIAVGVTVVIVGLTLLVARSIDTWFAVYAGILLAIMIRTPSDRLARYTGIPEKWAVAVALLLLAGLLFLSGWWLASPLKREAAELQQQLPQAIETLRGRIHSSGLDRFLPEPLSSAGPELASRATGMIGHVMSLFTGTFQTIITTFVMIFLGIYLSFSPRTYVNGLVALFPPAKRARARGIIGEAGTQLRYWILGQIVCMITVGGMISLGLYLSGVPVPIVLGVIAGILDVIPIFGPIIAAVPAILLGFTVSPVHALYAVITFVVANQLEGHLLIPLIQRYSISLPPGLTIVALLLMGSLFGFWGVLLAVPITATLIVLVKRVYIGEMLEHRPAPTKDESPGAPARRSSHAQGKRKE